MVTEVKQKLRERIRTGDMAHGDLIPPIDTLGERYDKPEGVVRKAIRELTEEGVIERKSGCFVVAEHGSHNIDTDLGRHALSFPAMFYPSVCRRLREKAKEDGRHLTIYRVKEYNHHPKLERELLLKLRRRDYNGVALVPSPIPPRNIDLFHEMRSNGIKVALLGAPSDDVSDQVAFLPNDRVGGYLLVQELSQRDFSEFVFVGRRPWDVQKEWILEGARLAADKHEVSVREVNKDLVDGGDDSMIEGKLLTEWIKSLGSDTAVVTYHGRGGSIAERVRQDVRSHYPERKLCTVCCFGRPPQGYEDLPRIRYDEARRYEYAVDYLFNDQIPADKLIHEWFDPVFIPGHLDE